MFSIFERKNFIFVPISPKVPVFEYNLPAKIIGAHSLYSFIYSMKCNFSFDGKPDSWLNFSWWDSRSFVIFGQNRGFFRNLLKNINDERVHNRHSFGRNAETRMLLLQYSVYVNTIRFFAFFSPEFSWGCILSSTKFIFTLKLLSHSLLQTLRSLGTRRRAGKQKICSMGFSARMNPCA